MSIHPTETFASIPGYLVTEQLYAGTRSQVYRAVRKEDQKRVVVKLLKREHPTFSELLQFRNQYTITKNLDSPNIIKAYSLENYRNSYLLVMEDFGGISLKEYTQNQPLELKSFLAIALQIAEILNDLYHHRIIHKDIKPGNLLINPETQQVKLTDFGIASLLPKETQEIQNPNVLEGTLAYLSPEQTGRMNRAIDYRSDFYALGITFYELLTGKLPFESKDAIELVHCHLAQTPPHIHQFNSNCPSVLANIVNRLMAKNAEDRYQSALGLKWDLEQCLFQLKETGKIESFELGKRDVSDRFLIPEKLYGRETEVIALLAAFDRVANGSTELILVAGFSGIGKTAVVNEVHKPIVKQRGYFIKGKFDQFNRNLPFFALVQAFRDLMGQLLSESDRQLQEWHTKIIAALGENAQVIIEVIPELERIIGKQPQVPKLSGSAAQNRFNLLFEKFIQVFTTKEHPLVIFIDDLQWADSASLKLMQLLMSETENKYLLLIGAYRDNEVSPTHPLMITLGEIQRLQAKVNTITLAPLTEKSINQLLADTLSCPLELALNFTKLVMGKTKGNPFFTTQFVKALYEQKLITFNYDQGYWETDISQIRQLGLTDDVVEFMAQQLRKLPQATQTILKLAACIGNQFDLATLVIVAEQTEQETASSLWKALQEGLILPQSEVYKFYLGKEEQEQDTKLNVQATNLSYKFLHDRVQQAAYFLIPEEERAITHQKIGKLLLQAVTPTEQTEKIFAIVNQLNFGVPLLQTETEKIELAQLNLKAGQKAKEATAYGPASQYLSTARVLLPREPWLSQYQLTLNIYIEAAEAEYLNINFTEANRLADTALKQTTNLLDQVQVYQLQMQICIAQLEMVKAVAIGLEVLEQLSIQLVAIEGEENLIIDLPDFSDIEKITVMTDPYKMSAMEIMKMLGAPVFMAKPEIFPQLIITMIKLCLDHGNSGLSSFAYGFYGLLLSGLGKLDEGYKAGKIALTMWEKFNARDLTAKVYNLFNSNIRSWKEHAKNSVAPLQEAVQVGLETGDLEWGGYCAANLCSYLFFTENALDFATAQQGLYIDLCQSIQQEIPTHFSQIWRQLGLNLQGVTPNPTQLIGESFDEAEMLPRLIEAKSGTVLFIFYVAKTILLYHLEDYPQALNQVALAEEQMGAAFGFIQVAILNFYHSLVLLGGYSQVKVTQQEYALAQVAVNQEKLQFWANHAPMNYQHKFDLIEAEKYQIIGKYSKAIAFYDSAIAGAKKNDYVHEEALANELAAKFYLKWGKEKVAAGYMQEAYYLYSRWGAKAKVDLLTLHYPQLLAPILQQQTMIVNPLETIATLTQSTSHSGYTSSKKGINQTFDLVAVIKAAQAISSTIEFKTLIQSLTKIILENAGGDKCALILPIEEEWSVQVIAYLQEDLSLDILLPNQKLEESQEVPFKLMQYVKHTKETLVIDNQKTPFLAVIGDYLRKYQPKSVMGLPIVNQGQLVGLLYLENRAMAGVFTEERLMSINFLCTQAAIALENARLYQQSQDYAQKLEASQLQLVQSEKMSALGNLVAGVAHEINNPVGFIAGNIEPAQDYIQDLLGLVDLYQENYPEPVAAIKDEIEAIDLEYLRLDLPKLIQSMKLGVDRIRDISKSLRTFSRADKEYKVPFNLHDGINSTLLILKHRLKAASNRPEITVVKQYDSTLPLISCFPGQLNQVFMNIIANAIDALEETYQECSRITIQTGFTDTKDYVMIKIGDNGVGMTETVKAKIFDHLFTTKAVGKGTGLGLAIARQIVEEKHGGKLLCHSVLGKGTEFIIKLPIS